MNAIQHALFDGFIDYAGLFPPAGLPLDEALRNYLVYRDGNYAPMLSHFVIASGQLADLAKLLSTMEIGEQPLSLSVLAGSHANGTEWLDEFQIQLAAMEALRSNCNAVATIACLEIKLPAELAAESLPQGSRDLLHAAQTELDRGELRNADTFFEIPSTYDSTAAYPRLAKRLAESLDRPGLKIRTGGMKAAAFPSVEGLATVLAELTKIGLPWKATAGLHHPLRQFRDEVGTEMHGFLNLLIASALLHAGQASTAEVVQILTATDADAFAVNNDGASWKSLHASRDEIEAMRTEGFTSVGSCSFTEPTEELRELGLLNSQSSPMSSDS